MEREMTTGLTPAESAKYIGGLEAMVVALTEKLASEYNDQTAKQMMKSEEFQMLKEIASAYDPEH